MFGHSIFRDDPFFNSPGTMEGFDQIDRMMSPFGMPGPPMMPSIGYGPHVPGLDRPSRRQEMMPFGGGMFGGNMFHDMDTMMSQMQSNPNTQFYSSSKVISYSNSGSGQPKYYEAASETTQGANGVRQTKRSERNSETGVDRMAVGHHIYDRGHVVERMRNSRTNEREEKQDFINIDEDERDRFHEEWHGKARTDNSRRALRNERYHHRDQPRDQPRALESAEYHRNNIERSRASQTNRRHEPRDHHDYRQNHVRINSRHDEV